jgi:hypothetical protein
MLILEFEPGLGVNRFTSVTIIYVNYSNTKFRTDRPVRLFALVEG